MATGNLHKVHELHEGLTDPISCIREQHRDCIVAHIVLVILSDQINDSFLFIALNIDVVICIQDTDLLVPKDECEYPVAAVPARGVIDFTAQFPLTTAGHDLLVTEHSGNTEIFIVGAEHVNLIFVEELSEVTFRLDGGRLFKQPSSEVGNFVVSYLYFVLIQTSTFTLRQGTLQVITVAFDVNDELSLLGRDT